MIIKREKELRHFKAADWAEVYEIFTKGEEVKEFGMAAGKLFPGQKAKPHYHKKTNEIYFIASGRGLVHVDGETEKIREGDTIFIPTGAVHALENNSDQDLRVLAISFPPYSEEDIFFVEE